jgi:peroxiredoxin
VKIGTTQACLFRDNYAPITDKGYAVYGLSTDSPKSNTTFVTKQSLPYPLLVSPVQISPFPLFEVLLAHQAFSSRELTVA